MKPQTVRANMSAEKTYEFCKGERKIMGLPCMAQCETA
jgi:hypothetical protein